MSEPSKAPQHRHISIFGVAALGIGSMVGAGVFALLGQIAVNVGSQTWVAFVFSGVAALISGYSYARLSAIFPSRGGVTDFFALGIPSARAERALSSLYLITLLLTLAMVAKAFGAYAARLLHQPEHGDWMNVYASAILVILTVMNLFGSKMVGRIEVVLVTIKLTILTLFIVVGTLTLQPTLLETHADTPPSMMFASIGLAFFAYSGFGLMASAAADVKNPQKDMPRAFMLAISLVMVLYIVLSLVVLGNVTPEALAQYTDTAVAEAAQPFLGTWGFLLMSLAALIATASSILANIFSMLSVSGQMGASGALPTIFDKPLAGGATPGFYLLVTIVIVLTNFFDLSSIANVASATFLACYLAVFVVCWRKRKECHANAFLLVFGFILMAMIFVSFIGEMFVNGLWLQIGTLGVAAALSVLIGWHAPTHTANREDSK